MNRTLGVGHSVVDQDVDAPVTRHHAFNQCKQAFFVGHIQHLDPMACELGLKCGRTGRVFLNRNHLAALRHELQRDGFAYAATCTGDEGYFVLKSHDLTAPAVRP